MDMKKAAVLVLALTVLLVLAAGCGAGNEGETGSGSEGTLRGGPVGQADSAACAANRNLINAAARQYQAVEGTYPASLQALVPGYLQSVPACPANGSYTLQGGKATCSLHGD